MILNIRQIEVNNQVNPDSFDPQSDLLDDLIRGHEAYPILKTPGWKPYRR